MAVGNGGRDAVPGERAGRVSSPAIGLLLGADALRTRGRPHWRRRDGTVSTDPAGSETPGRHGHPVRGTREALHLAWQTGPGRPVHPWGTTVRPGGRESDRCRGPKKPSNTGCPAGPAAQGEGRERAKGNGVQHTRGRTPCRVVPVTGARPRTAGPCGCLCVITRGRSPVRSCRTPGSVRGASGNRRPYRDPLDPVTRCQSLS